MGRGLGSTQLLAVLLKMLAVGLLLLALSYGVELLGLLAVAAVAGMNICVFSRTTQCCDMLVSRARPSSGEDEIGGGAGGREDGRGRSGDSEQKIVFSRNVN